MLYKEDILKIIDRLEAEKERAEDFYKGKGTEYQLDRAKLIQGKIESYKRLLPEAKHRKALIPYGVNPHTRARFSIEVKNDEHYKTNYLKNI